MASNLSGAYNSINDYITGVGAALGIISGNPKSLYSDDGKKVVSTIDPANWNKLPAPYTFSVMDLDLGSKSFDFEDFALPMAPGKISQSEPPATSIKPTQGGTVVSHSGTRYKKLTIEGTTGINPNRGMAGVNKTNGQAIAKPEELKFKSGYEVFLELRNWFRSYYEYKLIQGELAGSERLVFKNFKDGEFLIVELLDFTTDRTAERSFLYDYKMEFRVLAHFDFAAARKSPLDRLDSQIDFITSKIDVATGIFLGAQDVLRKIESAFDSTLLEPLRKINLAAKALAGTLISAKDIGKRVIKNSVTAFESLNILKAISTQFDLNKTGQSSLPTGLRNVKLPNDLEVAAYNDGAQTIVDLGEGMSEIPLSQFSEATQNAAAAEMEAAKNLPRSFYVDTATNLKRIKANAEDLFNLGSSDYDTLFDRTATLEAESTKTVTDEEFEILGALNDSITAINTLISYSNLFKSNFGDQLDSISRQFAGSINVRALPAVKQITIPNNTDLEQIALEELGDPVRWVEIAELNDLSAPYIVQDQSNTDTNVRRPGDSLLVPQAIQEGLSDAPSVKTIPSTVGLTELEKSFGTDLKVTEDIDLDIANNGDLAVVSGYQNIAQAVVLKLGYERGELRNHPALGVGLIVGGKFYSITQMGDSINGTLTQDKRINKISNLSLYREGSAVYLNFDLHVKKVDTPIPLRIAV